MTKPNPRNAPEPRVAETPDANLKLAVMLLWLACEHPHPRQRTMLAEYLIDNGLDLAARGRTRHDLAELKFRLVRLDRYVRDERNSEWSHLCYEIDEILTPRQAGEGDGCEF